jgi:hypothetical protein
MTLIAAISPPDGSQFFLCDTLVSVPGKRSQRMLGPSGLIMASSSPTTHKPEGLEQKTIIVGDRVFAANAGKSVIGKGVLRRLSEKLDRGEEPSRDRIFVALDGYEEELVKHDTSAIISFIENGRPQSLTLGPEFERRTLADGTVCVVAGSGSDAFFRDFEDVRLTHQGVFGRRLDSYHQLVMKLCGLTGSFLTHEAISAENEDHFGGIIEIIRATSGGFEKFPSASHVIEVIDIHKDDLTILGGNFLDYCYSGEILVYRRFGQIRGEEAFSVFNSNYLISTIRPTIRAETKGEFDAAIERMQRKSFQDSIVLTINWFDRRNIKQYGRVMVPGDNPPVQMGSRDGSLAILRTHEYYRIIANRFGVKEYF